MIDLVFSGLCLRCIFNLFLFLVQSTKRPKNLREDQRRKSKQSKEKLNFISCWVQIIDYVSNFKKIRWKTFIWTCIKQGDFGQPMRQDRFMIDWTTDLRIRTNMNSCGRVLLNEKNMKTVHGPQYKKLQIFRYHILTFGLLSINQIVIFFCLLCPTVQHFKTAFETPPFLDGRRMIWAI